MTKTNSYERNLLDDVQETLDRQVLAGSKKFMDPHTGFNFYVYMQNVTLSVPGRRKKDTYICPQVVYIAEFPKNMFAAIAQKTGRRLPDSGIVQVGDDVGMSELVSRNLEDVLDFVEQFGCTIDRPPVRRFVSNALKID